MADKQISSSLFPRSDSPRFRSGPTADLRSWLGRMGETSSSVASEGAQRLSEEEKRGIAEQLSEEELTIFDLLTKPEIKLTQAEEREVKKVAKRLLEKLKQEKLVLDWKKRQSTRAAVRYTIETVLDELQRTYTPDLYQQKCERVYQHVFDSYSGQGSLYASN